MTLLFIMLCSLCYLKSVGLTGEGSYQYRMTEGYACACAATPVLLLPANAIAPSAVHSASAGQCQRTLPMHFPCMAHLHLRSQHLFFPHRMQLWGLVLVGE
jgi:hypothetical protein